MNDVEYVLRLVLKARDEMSGVLTEAAAKLRAYREEVKGMDDSVDKVNRKLKTFSERIKETRKELGELKQASDDTGGSVRLHQAIQEDFAASTSKATSALNEQEKANISDGIASRRNARNQETATKAKKESTKASKEQRKVIADLTKEYDLNSSAVENRAAQLGLDAKATDAAAEKYQEYANNTKKATAELQHFHDELKGGNKTLDTSTLTADQKGQFADLAKRVSEAQIAEDAARQAITDESDKAEKLRREAQQQLIKEHIERDANTVSIEKSTEATKKEVVAEKESTSTKKKKTAESKESTKAIKEEIAATEELGDVTEKSAEKAARAAEKKTASRTPSSRAEAKRMAAEMDAELAKDLHDDPYAKRGDEFGVEDISFGGFGGVGGGAQRKSEIEKEMQRAQARATREEGRKLIQLETDVDRAKGSFHEFLQDFTRGNIDADTFVAKLQGVEKQLNRFADRVTQINRATPKQVRELMDSPEVMREMVSGWLEHASGSGKISEQDLAKVNRAIGKSDVAGSARDEVNAVKDATTADIAHSKSLESVQRDAEQLRDRMHALYDEMDRGKLTSKEAATAINDIGIKLGQMRRQQAGSPLGLFIGNLEQDAKQAAAAIRGEADANDKSEIAARRNAAAHNALRKEADGSLLAFHRLMADVRSGNVNWITARNQLSRYGDELQKFSRKLSGIDTHREVMLGEAASEARKAFAGFTRDGEHHIRTEQEMARASQGLTGWLNKLAEGANRAGGSVARVDNELRGMMVLAVIAFSQQLITLLDAAAGAAGALASSAIYAAGALGGGLVAGIAQALPMVGLLAASFMRVKQVMNAVQQQQLVQQQTFQRSGPQTKKQADTTDALANAEDGVKNAEEGVSQAHRRLTDAQRNLTQARIDARKQLRDLIAAERDAELQARGAALAQSDAQEALRQAVASGDVSGLSSAELRVSEAQQSNREAQQKLSDAHADVRRQIPRGVEGQDNVRNARQQVEDAKRGVTQAADAVVKAQRAMAKAARGADAAQADQFAGLQKLNFLLQKQLSPAERELYDRIQKLRHVYQQQFRPITDILTRQYTEGVNTAIKLLKDPRITGAAHGLATGMAREMSRVRKSFTDSASIDQFARIVKNGQRNLPAIGKIARNIGHALLNIAEEAGPALHRIINWFKDLSDRILAVTENRGRMASFFSAAADNAIAWLNALAAIVKMLAALAGVGQSEGMSMVKELTDWANKTTDNIHKNRSEVAKFFKESHDTLKIFLGFVADVAKAMLDVYSPSRLRPFAQFLSTVLLPALVTAMKLTGAVTALFLKILSLPVISQGAKLALTVLVITKLVTSLRTLFTMLMSNFAQFSLWADKLSGGGWNRFWITFGNGAKSAGKQLGTVVTAIGELLRKIPLLRNSKIPDLFTRAGGKLGGLEPTPVPGGGRGGTTVVGGGRQKPREIDPQTGRPSGYYSYPGGRGTPDIAEDIPTPRRRSRLRTLGRGLGIGALVGAGVYGMSQGQAGDLRAIQRKSGLGVATDELSGLAQNITSFNFGGAIKQIFGSTTAKDLKQFVGNFDSSLQQLTKKRDTKGLQDLSDKARDLAKEFPLYADALNGAADKADNARLSTKQLNDRLSDTQGLAAWFRHQGINISVKTQGFISKQQLADLKWYMQELQRGAPTSLHELGSQVHDEVQRINEAFAQGGQRTPEWFNAMSKTYEAAIKNVQRLQREHKISAQDARDQIGKLQDDLRLFQAKNPLSIGVDLVNSIVNTKGSRQKAIQGVIDDLKKMPPAARTQAGEMAIQMLDKMAKANPKLRDAAKEFRHQVGSQIHAMRDANVKRTWEMTMGIQGLIQQLPSGVKGAIQGVGDALNSALHALGVGRVKFDIPHAGKAIVNALGGNWAGALQAFAGGGGNDNGAAVGGRIGKRGMRGKDARPTWLGDGELVLNHWHEAAVNSMLPGQATVGDIVERIRGFHAGGPGQLGMAAGGYALGGVHPGIRKAALSVLKHFPQLTVTSTTGGGHAANSYHYLGEAVDIAGSVAVMNRAAQWIKRAMGGSLTEGIHNPGLSIKNGKNVAPGFWGATTWANHANHIHLAVAGALGKISGGVAQHIKRQLVRGPDGGIKHLLQSVMDKAVRAANRKIDRSQGSAQGGGDYSQRVSGGMGRGAVASVINQAMQLVGIPRNIRGAWRSMALDRAYQESAFNPNAQNNWDSNAAAGHPSKGLFQTIDSTFSSYALRGHKNILAPLDNAAAAFRYMLAAYGRGSWSLALSSMLGRRGVGYNTGGAVPGSGGGDIIPAMLTPGEHVWTKSEVEAAGGHKVMLALRKLLGGGTQSKGGGYAAGGRVLEIGDSLGVGIANALKKHFKNIILDNVVGRGSAAGVEALKKHLKKGITDVIFDLGTNDQTATALAQSLRKARKLVGSRDMVVSTVHGPDAASKNKVIRQFAASHDNVTVADWQKIARRYVGPDGVHPQSAKAYDHLANLVINAVKSGRSRTASTPAGMSDDQKLNWGFTTRGEQFRKRQANRGIYQMPADPIFGWTEVLKEIKRASTAITKSSKSWKERIRDINKEIEQIRDHDDTLSKKDKADIHSLREQRVKLQKKKPATNLDRFIRTVSAVTADGGLLDTIDTQRQRASAARQRATTFATYAIRRTAGGLFARNRLSAQEIAGRGVGNAQQDLADIQKQESTITDTRDAVQKQLAKLRKGGVTQKEAPKVRALETQLQKLRDDYDTIRDAHAAAEEALYQAQIAKQQSDIDAINKQADKEGSANQHWSRIWSALGRSDLVAKANEAQVNTLNKQADELAKQIPIAAAMGNTDLADQLTQQVQDLRDTAFESVQQALRDAADQINQAAQRRMGRLDLFGRMQSALGKMGLNSVVSVGGEQFSAAGVHAQQQATLENQRQQLQDLLVKVQQESPMNAGLIQDLTDQLAELDTTIQENTKAWFDARVQDVNDRFGRANTTLDLRKQIVELTGALPGNTLDNAALLTLEKQRTDALSTQATALQALLDEAIAAGNDQAVNDLTDQLLQNQIATLQNTQAIDDLTGATSAPQTYSSSAWQWFREAIFTGMGDVLPQYQVPGAAVGGIVTKSGLAYVHSGEPIVPAHIADTVFGGNGGDHMEFHMHAVDGEIDMTELAATVAFAKKTAQK